MSNVSYGRGSSGINIVTWPQVGWWFDHGNHPRATMFTMPGSGAMQHRPGTSHPASEGPVAATVPHSRLWFHDFLIKPVQRICKYPLLLEVLCSKAYGQGVNAVIVATVESMHVVAMHANEASRHHVAATRSKLIVECIEPHPMCHSPQLFSMM